MPSRSDERRTAAPLSLEYMMKEATWRGKVIAELEHFNGEIETVHKRINRAHKRIDNVEKRENKIVEDMNNEWKKIRKEMNDMQLGLKEEINQLDKKTMLKIGGIGGTGGLLTTIILMIIKLLFTGNL